jgi:RNA polymerase sigma-54 factor
MQFGYQLNQEQHARLFMSPELRQSIRILQLSGLELEAYLQERALDNPFIEIESARNRNFGTRKRRNSGDSATTDPIGSLSVREDTLESRILEQLRMSPYTREQFKAVSFLAGNLDDAGYLTIGLEEAEKALGMDRSVLESALALLQSFDPAGIGGRNLQECLCLQIRRDPDAPAYALQAVERFLPELAKGRFDKPAKEFNIPVAQVSGILDYVRTLNPKPGLAFGPDDRQGIVADAAVYFEHGQCVIELNRQHASNVTISKEYAERIGQTDCKETLRYYKEKVKSAEWLIRSLQYRSHTLFKVIGAIVEEQLPFLCGDTDELKPLQLKSVAGKLGVHESTVSRAVKDKYMHTPRGMFALKYFFSNGLSTDEGGEVSAKSVKGIIRQLIAGEDKRKPLSDRQIADLLRLKGIAVSRRTVAKYREEERILCSELRKQSVPQRRQIT